MWPSMDPQNAHKKLFTLHSFHNKIEAQSEQKMYSCQMKENNQINKFDQH